MLEYFSKLSVDDSCETGNNNDNPVPDLCDSSDSDCVNVPCNNIVSSSDGSCAEIPVTTCNSVKKRKRRRRSNNLNFPKLDLSKLHCSEIISCEKDDKVQQVNETFIVDKSLVDWSMESDVESNPTDQNKCKVSSPIRDDFERHELPLPSRLSSIGVNTTGRSDDSLKTFLAWLDQSLTVQETLLSEAHSMNVACNIYSFAFDISDQTIPEIMFDHLQHMKDCIGNFSRSDSSWMQRFNLDVDVTNIATEASDIVLELSPELSRCTRSKGKATEYPHVQPRILEYKHKKTD